MNVDELRDRLDHLGAEISAWPDQDRAAAEHLLASDPAARACLGAAQRVDDLISRAMRPGASTISEAADRVLRALPQPLPRQRHFPLWWAWPAALVGVAALGIMLGLLGPDLAGGDAGFAVASASADLAGVFDPEPLTGVRP
jgi:anti-sigma factor RsiW